MRSEFRAAVASGKFLVTAECVPPRMGGSDAVRRISASLPAELDAIVVADNPDEIHGSALACAALLAREGQPAILSLSTRDRNRVALESDALGASALDVAGVLCLTGNHQSLGVCPQAASANDIDSIQLAQLLRGLDLPDIAIGAVAHPYQQPLELNLLRLRKKIAAGVEFLLTEPVFDLGLFTRWMEAVRAAGLERRVAIVASVLPLTSGEEAERLRQRQTYGPLDEAVVARLRAAADPAKEGVAAAAKAAAALKDMAGIRGVHILSGGADAPVGELITAAGLA